MISILSKTIFKYRVQRSLSQLERSFANHDREMFLINSINHQLLMYKKFGYDDILKKFPASKSIVKWLIDNKVILLKPRTAGLFFRTIGQYAKSCSDKNRKCLVIDIDSNKGADEEILKHICNEVIHLTGQDLQRYTLQPIEKDGDTFLLENAIGIMGGRWLYEKIRVRNISIFDLEKLTGKIIINSPGTSITIADIRLAKTSAIKAINLVLGK